MSDIDLNAPEVQKAIKDAVSAAVESATEPLANKNKELLGELKIARKNSEITPEALETVEVERDQYKAELDKANKTLKDNAKVVEDATKALEGEQGFTKSLLIDNGLNDELVKVGVDNPAHLKAVKSMLKSLVTIEADGDKRIAKVGEKTLNEHVTEWAATDEGKNFVSASHNSGGGSEGGGGDSGKTNLTSTQKIAAGLKKL